MYDLIRTLNEAHILPILLVAGVVLLVIDYLFETDFPCQVGYFCFAAALFFALPYSVTMCLGAAVGLWILLVVLHFAWFRRFLNLAFQSMNQSLVMTIIGPDRPGLVGSLATIVAEHRGNWVESRMSHLAGQFAGILRVDVAQEDAAALQAALAALEGEGLRTTTASDTENSSTGGGECVELELLGQDQPGIVREIARALAGKGVNVEELETECLSAPMSGERMFKARARLQIPGDLSLDEMRAELERIASDLMVDLKLK